MDNLSKNLKNVINFDSENLSEIRFVIKQVLERIKSMLPSN